MEFFRPESFQEALEIKAAHPDAVPILGGTDIMVELNFDHRRPGGVLDLTGVPELGEWREEDGSLRVGAGVSYARIIGELGDKLPGLAMASRTVGSPQIRNRGTVGGNLGTASPAGDGLPPLYVSDAEIELASTDGARRVPVTEFVSGPKKERPRARGAHSGLPHAEGRRAAAVRQDRHPQRHGHRRRLLRHRSAPRPR